MKIDKSRVRKSTSDVPMECQQLIERFQACSRTELLEELSKINTWTFGKCELLHWAHVLDIFDKILGEAGQKSLDNKWALYCDTHYNNTEKKLLLWILHFTTLLIEHSFSRHLYNSLEHLLILLESNDMSVVLGVLNLLYMFSKRSNFISRLSPEKKNCLLKRLHYLAENWGGKENGFGLADCCIQDKPIPYSATTLHVEFHREDETKEKTAIQTPNIIHIEHIDKIHKTPADIMKSLLALYYVPLDKQMWLFTHLRLAHHFADYQTRLLCVQARLQALSVLVYSNALQDSPHNLLYSGLLEELVELVELKEPHLVEIRSAALRTLTAIIHLDRNPHIPKKPGSRLNNIIDVTGASQYHGFLPQLVRNCISTLTTQVIDEEKGNNKKIKLDSPENSPRLIINYEISSDDDSSCTDYINVMSPQEMSDLNKFPLSLATALFSFLYHLASYEAGGEALVSCGMMESLLQVINWHGVELEHITFVTRAVRVIDLISNIDMQAFQTHNGLQSFINRLDVEVSLCKCEQSYEIKPMPGDNVYIDENFGNTSSMSTTITDLSSCSPSSSSSSSCSSNTVQHQDSNPSTSSSNEINGGVEFIYHSDNSGKTCLPQRAALLKSMLNFLKKALQDVTFSDNIRHLMEGSLPNSLKNIIANAEYYGPSLFLLATDVVTVYVYQEPSLLSTLQDNGLTDVVLHSILIKEIPATREVLGSLPNVFSALCLNTRGLQSFIKFKPFEKTFSVLLSPEYLPAMRRRRSSEPMADTASNLGNAMDELMRHQPTLKSDAIKAIINLLEDLVHLGTDPKYICRKPQSKSEVSASSGSRSNSNTEGSSDEEEDDEEEASTSSQNVQHEHQPQENSERIPIALINYILNVMIFIDAILSNNSTDDHCREFVQQGGLKPLLKILGLSNLPVNLPITTPAQAVATVCKSILNLAHETNLFKESLSQLSEILETLKPMYSKLDVPSGPKLLLELAGASNIDNAFNNAGATPLLHAMSAAHGYIIMLVHVCRTGQSEIRNLSLQNWGSEEGLRVIKGLADLYTSLVWESTLLLAYCSEEYIPSDFTREDVEKLNAFFDKCESNTGPSTSSSSSNQGDTVNVASAMEALSTNPPTIDMDVDQEGVTINLNTSLKYIKPLLGASSRLGRALAELFGLLVKLCVGSPIRQRRGQNIISAPTLPIPYARSVATALNVLLVHGLDYERLPACPSLKSRVTFLICSIGFTGPMLFDEKRYPYHLMLKEFVTLNGLSTFFNTFRWVITSGGRIDIEDALVSATLPEGIAGFLDTWLILLEKIVNPKAILESPHVISNRSSQGVTFRGHNFEPLKYLIQIHKLAFESIMLLWGKTAVLSYGTRLTENILTILRHILRGEKIIKEKTKPDDSYDLSRPKSGPNNTVVENVNTTNTASAATATGAGNSSNSNLDPGINPESFAQLMDMGFPPAHVTDALLNTVTVEQATDYLLSNTGSVYSHLSQSSNSDSLEDEQVLQAIEISLGTDKKKQNYDDSAPLSEHLINEFTTGALDACLRLLDATPEAVHKICELLVTIIKRNGRGFRDITLNALIKELCKATTTCFKTLLNENPCHYRETFDTASVTLANYLHLFILFFEVSPYFEMKIPCANAVHKKDYLHYLIELISFTESNIEFCFSEYGNEPQYLAPAFLLIDAVLKVSLINHRKRNMHLNTTRQWRWFHIESGKWTPYSAPNNKLINEAYWNGEQSLRVTCGRRRYTITFNNMLQLNDESGNNRPICMSFTNTGLKGISDPTIIDLEESITATLTPKEDKRCLPIVSIEKVKQIEILRVCCSLLHTKIEKELLHSILQICIRLTRDHVLAKIFVQEGGIKCILNMRQMRDFSGFGILATIIIRHTLEEPNIIRYAMEKIIRARTLPTIPPSYKELHYLARQIGGAIIRAPDLFFDVAKNTLRIDEDRGDIESSIIVKSNINVRSRIPIFEDTCSVEVIFELLNALLRPSVENDTDKAQTTLNTSTFSAGNSSSSGGGGDLSETESIDIITGDSNNSKNESTQTDSKTESLSSNEKHKTDNEKMMLPKSVILKILNDIVLSFTPVAKIVTEYVYRAGTVDYLKEDTTAIAFILDKLLPDSENVSDPDCPTLSRMLIGGIAASNHCPEAQSILVNEVRAALLRALLLPESAEKHTQVQLIAGVVSIMIDSCSTLQAKTKNIAPIPQMNNIVKLMIRKGLFNDLARVPHYLDLSSPNTPFTVNACLIASESLSRITNQPLPPNVPKNKKQPQNVEDNSGIQTTSNEENTNNQRGEIIIEDSVVIEDPENTEHDIAVVASTIEVEGNDNEDVLVHMIDQLLEQGNENNQTFEVPTGRNHTMDIDEDGNLTYEHERDATEELMSTDSGESDSNPSDQVEDEENDDNDGDDENIDDNDDNNYDDDDDNGGGSGVGSGIGSGVITNERRRSITSYMDRNDDVLMIQYTNPSNDNVVTRMVAYPMATEHIPLPLFDEIHNTSDHTGPVIHPLLLSRNNTDVPSNALTRAQRANRARRYQYLFNTRNPNPPVILQRLLGPHEPQVTLGTSTGIITAPPEIRESARLVLMDNFGLLPSHEEQIDFVDQSGYLFGPSLAATLNQISPVLHWWNIESKCLDFESVYDCVSTLCNKLLPILIKNRNIVLAEKKKVDSDSKNTKTMSSTPHIFSYEDLEDQATMLLHMDENLPLTRNRSTALPVQTSNEGTNATGPAVTTVPSTSSTSTITPTSATNLVSDASSTTTLSNISNAPEPSFEVFPPSNTIRPALVSCRRLLPPTPIDVIENNVSDNISNDNIELIYCNRHFNASPPTLSENVSQRNTFNNLIPSSISEDMFSNTLFHRPDIDFNSSNADTIFQNLVNDFDDNSASNQVSLETATNNDNEINLPDYTMSSESSGTSTRVSTSSSSDSNPPINLSANNTNETTDNNVVGNSVNNACNDTFIYNDSASTSTQPISPSYSPNPSSSSSSSITLISTTITANSPSTLTTNDEEIPDGVDPSFLEALPPDMRSEVLEQHRILRLQQTLASRQRSENDNSGLATEVSPEFLAALPPSLQEEVLSQQRLEQQRQAAAQANPNEPVDAASFFETLQPSLRTMILSDMEDSQMSVLPPDLAAEAQTLRRDWEARNRQMVHMERMLHSNLTSIRHSVRNTRQPLHNSSGHFHRAQWTHWNREFMNNTIAPTPPLKIKGRQLLDHEGLSCLLVLLFTDDPHLGKIRLHRVIRNLCYHAPTREWIINALLSIVDKCANTKPDETLNKPLRKSPKPGPLSSKLMIDPKLFSQNSGNWLNIRMEAALGCSANVFIINKSTSSKRSEKFSLSNISIHPQAAPIICKNALELFTSLAKTFPSCLLPIKCIRDDKDDKINLSPVRVRTDYYSDFWEILLKLDSVSTKKGKSIPKVNSFASTSTETDNKPVNFEQSVFGHLLNMLSSPVINRNTQLTDNLLRLLSVITSRMPELVKPNVNTNNTGGNTIAIHFNPTSNVNTSVGIPETTTAPPAATSRSSNKNKIKIENLASNNALHLAVNVITYKNCSEEGLEFITNLLLNLSSSTVDMSYMILNLLLNGAIRIGEIVKEQIQNMLKELKDMNNAQKRKVIDETTPSTSKGTISNRFTKETVVITASTKIKTSCELQLPSMIPLTSKNSSQLFFLRVLRVIVQIRNSFKQNVRKNDSSWTYEIAALCDQLTSIDSLWETLSQCLLELEHTPDHHAVLVLQPAVEAFFLVHSPQQGAASKLKDESNENLSSTSSEDILRTSNPMKSSTDSSSHRLKEFVLSDLEPLNSSSSNDNIDKRSTIPPEQMKFLTFAEKHRRVLNQILRQSTSHLADGPFAVLVDHTRILDFDIKRRYFRSELERMDQGIRREETAVHVRRSHIFEDSFRELYRRSAEEWKNRFYIVFEDEEGQDAGGLLREWYVIISRDIFNPMYALFTVSPGDRVTYMINSASHYNPNHLCYYKFVGRVIAKAIYDNKLLECYFTRSFYKHILGIPVKYTDMESEDYSFYRGLVYLMENNINNLGLDLTFSTEINEFGVTETRDLVINGRHVPVTEETKMEYIRLSCQMKMTGAIKQQLNAFLEGFYDIIPMRLISIFNEQELELLISGLPNVDIDDLKTNTEYHKYQANSLQIQWFWRALRSFDQADRAKFLQFVTGTSKVPLQGFGALEGMNGVQKFQIHRDDRSTDRLPSAHTCFNQLDLPVYETYDKLRSYLLKAIHECSEGFGFA